MTNLTSEAYTILGVQPTAAFDEIKRAYRKIARENHPDVLSGCNPEEVERRTQLFKDAALAYETLSKSLEQRSSTDTPSGHDSEEDDSEVIIHEGVKMWVRYSTEWVGRKVEVLIAENDFPRLQSLPLFTVAATFAVTRGGEWQEVIVTGFDMDYLRWRYDHHLREEAKRKAERARQKTYDRLWNRCTSLYHRDVPMQHLEELWRKLERVYQSSRFLEADSLKVQTLFRAVEHELGLLEGDPEEVILDCFVRGKLEHPDIQRNQLLLERLEALHIQFNGITFVPTQEEVEDHYRNALRGVRSLSAFNLLDLRLFQEDYAPREWLEDRDVERAPEVITIPNRKSTSSYEVKYFYAEVRGGQVAVGVIRIPLSLYEKNAGDHGKPSSFPSLPFGIRLLIEVLPPEARPDTAPIASGFDDDVLRSKVAKYKRGRRRGEAISSLREQGYAPVQGTELPPWHRGAKPRW